MAKEREEKRKHEVSYFDETRAGGAEPFLKSVPVHAIDLRQIEPSYKVRWWVFGRMGHCVENVPGLYAEAVSRRVAGEPSRDFGRGNSNSNRNEARAAAESRFEEEYLSSIKRHKLVRHLNRQFKRNS